MSIAVMDDVIHQSHLNVHIEMTGTTHLWRSSTTLDPDHPIKDEDPHDRPNDAELHHLTIQDTNLLRSLVEEEVLVLHVEPHLNRLLSLVEEMIREDGRQGEIHQLYQHEVLIVNHKRMEESPEVLHSLAILLHDDDPNLQYHLQTIVATNPLAFLLHHVKRIVT